MRATQFIEMINAKVMPDAEEELFLYTHISFTDKLKKTRRKYRRNIKNAKK